MAKRPDTLETLLLALELLRRIPRKNKITARELQAQLQNAGMDRDLRTIQRMLETFSEHFEIERDDRSKPYGFRWQEASRGMAVSHLTPQESLLLQLAQEHLRNLLPPRLIGPGGLEQVEERHEQQRHDDPEREVPAEIIH